MPKPYGTYNKIRHYEKIRHVSKRDKIIFSSKNKSKNFILIDSMQRKMAVLQDWIKNGALTSKSKEDEIRDNIKEAIELFESYIEKYQAYEQLKKELQEPSYLILRAQPDYASHADLLALAIALCKVFSLITQIVGRR